MRWWKSRLAFLVILAGAALVLLSTRFEEGLPVGFKLAGKNKTLSSSSTEENAVSQPRNLSRHFRGMFYSFEHLR